MVKPFDIVLPPDLYDGLRKLQGVEPPPRPKMTEEELKAELERLFALMSDKS